MNKYLLTILSTIAFSTVFAQTDFSGHWTLKSKQQVAGPEYSNGMATEMTVSQKKDSIYLEITSMGGDGNNVTNKSSFAMDGKEVTSKSVTTKRKYVKNIEWSADKKTLTMKAVFYIPENDKEIDLTRVEKWTINDKGELTVNKKSIETRSETWEVNGIFEKK